MQTRVGVALAAAFLLSLNGALAAEHPKVNANGTATEEATETEPGEDQGRGAGQATSKSGRQPHQRSVPE